jgi:transposase InsO family protein
VEKALYLVQAHLIEGISVAQLARDHSVDPSSIYRWLARYRSGGAEALRPGSRRPKTSPTQTPIEVEEAIVLIRKQLSEDGLDAGAETIHYHLARRFDTVPSVSTIWRILKRRGFVEVQPKKRPRSSFCRFAAELPNQMWQSDMTHWRLGTGVDVEIVTYIDDCSRLVVGCEAVLVTKATDVVAFFHKAAQKWGYPASVLTDNGCIYTAKYRGGKVMMESVLESLGIVFKHGKPYHPQTQGKVERFQQTLKKWLSKQFPANNLSELQHQLDRFCHYYNEVRPHRSVGNVTPKSVFDKMIKAFPGDALPSSQFRVRNDVVHANGKLTLRYESKLLHLGIGRAHKGTPVTLFVAGPKVRVVTSEEGELIATFEIDPTKNYQPKLPDSG